MLFVNNSSENVGFPLTESHLDDAGRLVGHLCRLQAQLYTGLAVVDGPEDCATFVFVRGAIVFVEDSGGDSLSQSLRRDGHLDGAAWSRAVRAATERLSDCQDLIFAACCQELGLLPSEVLAPLVRDRVRARVIRAMGWRDCDVTLCPLDDIPDVACGWGTAPAADAYLGVRTFFVDEDVADVIAEAAQRYPKVATKPTLIATWLSLDVEEGRLLDAMCRGDRTVEQVVSDGRLEPAHAWQLVAVLALAHWMSFTSAPATGATEHSSIRNRPQSQGGARLPIQPPSGYPAEPIAPSVLPPPRPRQAPARSVEPAVRDDEPTLRVERAADEPTQRVTVKAEDRAPAPTRPDREPRTARATVKQPASALDRLGRELKLRRGATSVARAESGPIAAAAVDEYGKAHLRELVRRRMNTTQGGRPRSLQELGEEAQFARARSQLQQEAFAPAAAAFADLVAAAPSKRIYLAYERFALLRANPAPTERASLCEELRELLAEFASDPAHKAFVYHALGHVSFAQGDDLGAEKAFRRALERDRKNKDAERYLKILERRRASKPNEPQKIFGIEIGSRKGKP